MTLEKRELFQTSKVMSAGAGAGAGAGAPVGGEVPEEALPGAPEEEHPPLLVGPLRQVGQVHLALGQVPLHARVQGSL